MADGHELTQALRDLVALQREQIALVRSLADSESARVVAALTRLVRGQS